MTEPTRPALGDLPLLSGGGRTPGARSLAGALPNDAPGTLPPSVVDRAAHRSSSLPPAARVPQPSWSGLGKDGANPAPTDTTSAAPTDAPAPGASFGLPEEAGEFDGSARWSQVVALRDEVTTRWQAENAKRPMDEQRDRMAIIGLIDEQLLEENRRAAAEGRPAMTLADRKALQRAVLAGIFGAGRFQRFLDMTDVENIEIEGHAQVTLQYADGTVRRVPSPWSSDDELIADIAHLARTGVSGERQFSITHKTLRMSLPDGSRMAAEGWLTPWPSVTIRRHRFLDTDLAQAVELGTVDESLREFLEAAFRSGKNLLIVGDAASGKTTLGRAIINALDPDVRIATIESMYELGMHRLPHRHRRVWAAEAQEGGEIGADGRPIGGIDLVHLVGLALQKNTQRLIVGEVVGPEALALINAMQGGSGSLSTLHAASAKDAVDRLANLLMQASGNITLRAAYNMIATNVDYIVHVSYINEGPIGGSSHRFVDEVVELASSQEEKIPYTVNDLWLPGPDGRATPTGNYPGDLATLERWGLDRNIFEQGTSRWGAPLRLKIPVQRRAS